MTEYDIHLDEKFGQLTQIDLDVFAAAHEPWFNQTLTSVNDAVVRLGVIDGDFHWHKHDDEDEFFLVLDGVLLIDMRAATPCGSGAISATRSRAGSCTAPARQVARRSSWSSPPACSRPATRH